jgi:large subunit ribosomal protein L7/L12
MTRHRPEPIGSQGGDVDVVLAEVPGSARVDVTRALRQITAPKLRLSNAVALVDAAPTLLAQEVTRPQAYGIREKVEEAGGKVELRPAGAETTLSIAP